jgi:hypothetical protein
MNQKHMIISLYPISCCLPFGAREKIAQDPSFFYASILPYAARSPPVVTDTRAFVSFFTCRDSLQYADLHREVPRFAGA